MPAGRPSSYNPKYPKIAQKMCELGAIDTEIASALGICIQTFHNWKNNHPEFMEALKVGKSPADQRVKMSLYHRALGYSHPEDDIRTVTLPNGGGSEVVITPTTKHYPPDTTACIFWLKNRMPEEFRAAPEPTDEVTDRTLEIVRATKPSVQE